MVFREPLSQPYKATRLSIACLFVLLCNALVVLLPFFFLTSSNDDGGLWKANGTYREQPSVKFLYKFIMVLEATSPSTEQTKEIFVSTLDSLNVLRPESYRPANVEVHENDTNLDNKFDSFTLEAEVPLGEDEQIQSMQALVFFDYKIQSRVKFDMESVAYTSFESGLPISGYDTKGALELRQTNPLGIRDYSSTLYADETPLVDIFDSPSVNNRLVDSNVARVLNKHRERNVVVDYVEHYPIKSRASNSGESSNFHFKMKVDIPDQEVLYIPTLIEVLKTGWIQYLSVVVVCWFLVERIKRFVFVTKLLPALKSKKL